VRLPQNIRDIQWTLVSNFRLEPGYLIQQLPELVTVPKVRRCFSLQACRASTELVSTPACFVTPHPGVLPQQQAARGGHGQRGKREGVSQC
jgi:hypothetical protein